MEELDGAVDALVEESIVQSDIQGIVCLPLEIWVLDLGKHKSGIHAIAKREVVARSVK